MRFLEALATAGAVRVAAATCGISHQTAYRARRADAAFRLAWDAALLAARAHAEDVLACRALDGVEEQVFYHGEVIATRRRFDSRLLLAHLARLDRLTADARVSAFADDFDEALARFARGEAQPEPEGEEFPSGQCNMRSSRSVAATDGGWPEEDCEDDLAEEYGEEEEDDGLAFERRLVAMEKARPEGVPDPFDYGNGCRVEEVQLAAFEAGDPEWWLVMPPEGGAPRRTPRSTLG